MAQSYGLLNQLNRAFLTLLMAIAWSGWIYLPAMAANGKELPAVEATAKRQASVKHLNNCFRALEAGLKQVPRDTFSLSDVAASIGNDPAAAAAWVREHTTWVPYSGALRGPLGVLMDRRGSSLDRATLLAELLHRDGRIVRVAHGTLADAAASKLRDVMALKPVQESPIDARTSAQGLFNFLILGFGNIRRRHAGRRPAPGRGHYSTHDGAIGDISRNALGQSSRRRRWHRQAGANFRNGIGDFGGCIARSLVGPVAKRDGVGRCRPGKS